MATMYIHTLDGRPARLLRFTRGRVAMVPVTPGVRLVPLASISDIRREWNECLDDELHAVNREHGNERAREAAMALHKRHGYVLIKA